jgi:hypothetical protein
MMLRQYTTNEQVNEENLYEERVENKDPDTYREIDDDQEDQTAFTHLENFLYDEEHDDDPEELQPSHLHRLLEYVETPSLMPGARTWLNPGYFSYPAGQAPPVLAAGDPRRNRLPPFNWVSVFREPGRLNLNTLSSPRVYAGLFHAEDPDDVEPDADEEVHPGPRWDDNEDSLTRSRRGYGDEEADILSFDNGTPTFFANPFRAPNTGDLVPLPNMVRHGIEGTLLRSTSANAGEVDENPLFVAETGDDHNDADRSPFFHFAPMIRLDNLTTRQSNVYAVWITIGYFEVEDIAGLDNQYKQAIASNYGQNSLNDVVADPASKRLYEAVYPDGYTLGKEDGLDEGDVRRMRGFYIIDRSRPVGFEPGNDLNVEKTIRLRRRIE